MTSKSNVIGLSGYDQSLGVGMPPFFRMLCYSYVPDIEKLALSLEQTFKRFPRFATRLVRTPGGESKLVVTDRPPALELRSPVSWTPESFCVEHFPAFVGGLDPAPDQAVIAATLRQISNGSVLSVSLSHSAGDFYSLYLFLSSWCEQFGSVHVGGSAALAGDRAPAISRSEVGGPIGDGRQVDAQGPNKARSTGIGKHNYSVLSFDREFLSSLRAELSTEHVALTLNEVLTAFIVHRHGRAIMGRTTGLRLRVPVNVRGVHPAIPADFVGNGIVEAIVPLDELVDSPAAARRTAQRLHETVEAVRTREYVESALQVLDGQVELKAKGLPIYNRQTDLLATNLSRMHFHKLDFGSGPPTQIFGTHTGYNGLSISSTSSGLEVRVFSEHGSVSAA